MRSASAGGTYVSGPAMGAGLPRTAFSYYAAVLRSVLRRPGEVAAFALATSMHALGHAGVAFVGAVASARTGGVAPRGLLSGALLGAGGLADRAFALSLAGLVTIATKSVAGVYATYVQSRVAGDAAAALRLELLDALLAVHHLRRPRHACQGGQVAPTASGVAALTDHVREIEAGLGKGLLGGARAVAQLVPLGALLVALSPRMALAAAVVQGGWGSCSTGSAPGTVPPSAARRSIARSCSRPRTSRCATPTSGSPTAPRPRHAARCARWVARLRVIPPDWMRGWPR